MGDLFVTCTMVGEWFKFPPCSFVEPAEHFVVFQTQHLDAHKQALQRHHKQVAHHHNQHIQRAACHFGQGEHHRHHARMGQHKAAHTQKAHGVGGKAQHGIEHFEKAVENDFAGLAGLVALGKLHNGLGKIHHHKRHHQAHNQEGHAAHKGKLNAHHRAISER